VEKMKKPSTTVLVQRIRNYYIAHRASWFARRLRTAVWTRPVVSFTFDDFPQSALLVGGKILHRFSIRGSYYASLGSMGKESPVGKIFHLEDIQALLDEGHELGCHTYDHLDAWDTHPVEFEASVRKNQTELGKLFPGRSFRTSSYPITDPHPRIKQITARYFDCSRGGGQTFNNDILDLNLIKSCFIDRRIRDNSALLRELIDKNRQVNGWLVFSTHDICETPSPYGCTPNQFQFIVEYSVNSGALILPVCEAYSVLVKDG
jgi:peptidoglycan/xylan/chitin deacetylase (PgdA/CDA1 family)